MRLLKSGESALIKALLMTNSQLAEVIVPTLNTALVEDMDDGGMGSLRFKSCAADSGRRLGKTVAEAEFLDEDAVPVSVELNLDEHSQLFELDVWKFDYSRVSRWPDLGQVVIKGRI
ncbi:hypothetical protein QT972_03250 [Microcoleus sp. herbarium7]|uniref:DUF6984 family protein n=1 Tax=Microcoleus sp. herbarium7 TaxID=3055435 RepID=UPI003B076F31